MTTETYADMNKNEICEELEKLTGLNFNPKSWNRDQLIEKLVEARGTEATEATDGTYTIAKGKCVLAKNGMYYKEGDADFSISSGSKKVVIKWQVGPRYGRGWRDDIILENSNITLLKEADLWVS